MSGYLQRLMRQSAVTIKQSDAEQKITPAADIVEEETVREAPRSPPAAILAGPAHDPPSATAVSPARTDRAPAQPESGAEGAPELESPRLSQSIETPERSAAGAIPFVSIGQTNALAAPNEQIPATKTDPSMDESLARERISSAAPNAQEIVQEVVAWVTDTRNSAAEVESTELKARTRRGVEAIPVRSSRDSQKPGATNAPFSAVDSPRTDFPESGPFHSAEAHSSASPMAKTEPWSIQIDSIHLTIEEPAAKLVATPVAPRVTPPAVAAPSGFTPSQLRRHYLRPF